MSTHSWQNRLYSNLLRESQKSAFQRHCAYMAAGWLSLFLVRPRFAVARAPSFSAVAGGGVLLVVALVLLVGPLLNTLQPVLRAAGHAPAVTWPVAFVAAVFGWRYLAGRKLLTAYAASGAA
jgi:hypothetical protein